MNLDDWLSELETRHPSEIDLGLDRTREVLNRLSLSDLPYSIVIGGTNGKGSTLASIERGLAVTGMRVGAYTSPHFHRFNERICINGEQVSDARLVEAFELVERARADTSLTYFEFTTLASFLIFANAYEADEIDVMICEVGLGGRLDAVNVIDADLSVVVSIGLDHQEWLGDSLEQIAREKAGVFRSDKTALIGETFPKVVQADLESSGYQLLRFGEDFGFSTASETYPFLLEDDQRSRVIHLNPLEENSLPKNNLCLAMQACIIALNAKSNAQPEASTFVRCAQAISGTRVVGRLQYIEQDVVAGNPAMLLDVAHNAAAAETLANYLRERHAGSKVIAVFSCLKDKDIHAIVNPLAHSVDVWCVAEIDSPRALERGVIASALDCLGARVDQFDSLQQALCGARAHANEANEASLGSAIILAFGSFYVLEAIEKAR